MEEFKILIHRLDTQVDGLGFEELHQITLICQQVFLANLVVVGMVEFNCPKIGMDGVLRKIALSELLLKSFGCPHLRYLQIIFLRNNRSNIIEENCDYLLL